MVAFLGPKTGGGQRLYWKKTGDSLTGKKKERVAE